MSELRTRCPFSACDAMVLVLMFKGGKALAQHVTEPDSWFGMCPASLQAWPVTADVQEMLAGQLVTYRKMRDSRKPPVLPRENAIPEHPLTPHPHYPSNGFGNGDAPST